jgi:hypothetical protein
VEKAVFYDFATDLKESGFCREGRLVCLIVIVQYFMKLEFLDDISRGGYFKNVVSDALVRLFDFDSNEASQFQQTIKKLIDDEIEVHLDGLPLSTR